MNELTKVLTNRAMAATGGGQQPTATYGSGHSGDRPIGTPGFTLPGGRGGRIGGGFIRPIYDNPAQESLEAVEMPRFDNPKTGLEPPIWPPPPMTKGPGEVNSGSGSIGGGFELPFPNIPNRVPPRIERWQTGQKMIDGYANGWQPNPILTRLLADRQFGGK